MDKRKILLVDDEPDVVLSLRIVLEDAGYAVDSFSKPLMALADFKSCMYDLLLLDVKMAQMTGFELYQKIKEIDDVRVCFLTAGEMFYDEYQNMFPNVDKTKFLLKPVQNEKLLSTVKSLLE